MILIHGCICAIMRYCTAYFLTQGNLVKSELLDPVQQKCIDPYDKPCVNS